MSSLETGWVELAEMCWVNQQQLRTSAQLRNEFHTEISSPHLPRFGGAAGLVDIRTNAFAQVWALLWTPVEYQSNTQGSTHYNSTGERHLPVPLWGLGRHRWATTEPGQPKELRNLSCAFLSGFYDIPLLCLFPLFHTGFSRTETLKPSFRPIRCRRLKERHGVRGWGHRHGPILTNTKLPRKWLWWTQPNVTCKSHSWGAPSLLV